MKKINNTKEYKIEKFDGVIQSSIYTGGFYGLKPAFLVWNADDVDNEIHSLTLDEIKEQIKKSRPDSPLITIFIEGPTEGKILQYGNYGDEWWEIGSTCGYM